MYKSLKLYRLFGIALTTAILLVAVKFVFHDLGWEIIAQSSLHNSVISSVTFVIGFLLSTTIADYKESERMPAEFAATVEDMYYDAASIYQNYKVFDLDAFRSQLRRVAQGFKRDVRRRSYDTRKDIVALGDFFAQMEAGKVPPNFIVKLKQQQSNLLRARHRVDYIQKIKFIPSATVLSRSIVLMVLLLLLLTNIDPFYGGLAIVGLMAFILVYMLLLINVISTPFHGEGKTLDDVSLFLIDDAAELLKK